MAEADGPARRSSTRIARPDIRDVYALVVVAGLLVVLYLARGTLAPYLLAFLGVYILLPVVQAVERRLSEPDGWTRFRRPLAVLVAVVGALVALGIVLTVLIRPVVGQTTELFNDRAGADRLWLAPLRWLFAR